MQWDLTTNHVTEHSVSDRDVVGIAMLGGNVVTASGDGTVTLRHAATRLCFDLTFLEI